MIGEYFKKRNEATRPKRKEMLLSEIHTSAEKIWIWVNEKDEELSLILFLNILPSRFSFCTDEVSPSSNLSTITLYLCSAYLPEASGLPLNPCHFRKYCLTKWDVLSLILHIIKCSSGAWSWICLRLVIVGWGCTGVGWHSPIVARQEETGMTLQLERACHHTYAFNCDAE